MKRITLTFFILIVIVGTAIGCAKAPEAKFKDYLIGLISVLEQYDEKNPKGSVQAIDKYIEDNRENLIQITNELSERIKNAKKNDQMDDYIASILSNIHPLTPKLKKLESQFIDQPQVTEVLDKIADIISPLGEVISDIQASEIESTSNATPKPVEDTKPAPEASAETDAKTEPEIKPAEGTEEPTEGGQPSAEEQPATVEPATNETETEPAPQPDTPVEGQPAPDNN